MLGEEGFVFSGLLVGLNVIDCNFDLKGEDLDSQVQIDSGTRSKQGYIFYNSDSVVCCHSLT